MALTVILDTSFLMLSAKFHIDVLAEAETLLGRKVSFAVPDPVVDELRRLATRRGAQGRDARIALELIDKRKIRHVHPKKRLKADPVLVDASRLSQTIVATADNDLRNKIRSAGKPVIFFREKAKLELEGIEAAYC